MEIVLFIVVILELVAILCLLGGKKFRKEFPNLAAHLDNK